MWVHRQRKSYAANSLNALNGIGDREKRLEALPGWSWATHDEKWESAFANLLKFAEREGHCNVPSSRKTDLRLLFFGSTAKESNFVMAKWILTVVSA